MSATPSVEEQSPLAGLPHCRRHDITYRVGLVIQVFGAAIFSVLYPLASPFFTVGIMVFEAGVLLSAVFVSAWAKPVKQFIVSSVVLGLALQIGAGFLAPEQYALTGVLCGIGLVCAGAGVMMGREAYYFGYWEGWLLAIFGFPVMIAANLIGKEPRIFNAVWFSLGFLLLLSLTGKKLRQHLPT